MSGWNNLSFSQASFSFTDLAGGGGVCVCGRGGGAGAVLALRGWRGPYQPYRDGGDCFSITEVAGTVLALQGWQGLDQHDRGAR